MWEIRAIQGDWQRQPSSRGWQGGGGKGRKKKAAAKGAVKEGGGLSAGAVVQYSSRSRAKSGQFCTKRDWIGNKEVSHEDEIMHTGVEE